MPRRGHCAAARARAGRRVPPAARGPRTERGAVTAETAMVLPLLVMVATALAWLLALAATQVRVVDAAREVARAVARDESRAAALALGHRVAPPGSTINVEEGDRTVLVRVRAPARAPAWLAGLLPVIRPEAEAVAAEEDR